jgi:hypothetical protein
MFKDDDEDDNLAFSSGYLAFSSGYAFEYSGNDPYSGKLDDGKWYICGKAHGNETQNDALNAALNQWIEALTEDQRAALKQVMV